MKKKIQKPFDVEAAKNGAKVETREGRSVRIICYDREGGKYPIIALLDSDGYEICNEYDPEGKISCSGPGEHDLVIVEEVECPKFNVGDWVIAIDGECPWLITAVTSDCYEIQNLQGDKVRTFHSTIDIGYRLWTLKDAKPGDVLIYEYEFGKNPFIFKETFGGYPTAYCGIDTINSIVIGTDGLPWTRSSVKPATKEERGTLFKKMEEAGYKWDKYTLTLSKIQKRWRDDEHAEVNGYYINHASQIISHSGWNTRTNYNTFATEKQAKSAIAMARISQIMANDERFGGVVTDDEWDGRPWYNIVRVRKVLIVEPRSTYEFLAFHTLKQADLFLEENKDLIKDYYMLD